MSYIDCLVIFQIVISDFLSSCFIWYGVVDPPTSRDPKKEENVNETIGHIVIHYLKLKHSTVLFDFSQLNFIFAFGS